MERERGEVVWPAGPLLDDDAGDARPAPRLLDFTICRRCCHPRQRPRPRGTSGESLHAQSSTTPSLSHQHTILRSCRSTAHFTHTSFPASRAFHIAPRRTPSALAFSSQTLSIRWS